MNKKKLTVSIAASTLIYLSGYSHASNTFELGLKQSEFTISDYWPEKISISDNRLQLEYEDLNTRGKIPIKINRKYNNRYSRPGWVFSVGEYTFESVNYSICDGNKSKFVIRNRSGHLNTIGHKNKSSIPDNTIASLSDGANLICENNRILVKNNGYTHEFDNKFNLIKTSDSFGNYLTYNWSVPTNTGAQTITISGSDGQHVILDASYECYNGECTQGQRINKISYNNNSIEYKYNEFGWLAEHKNFVGISTKYKYYLPFVNSLSEVIEQNGFTAKYGYHPINAEDPNNNGVSEKKYFYKGKKVAETFQFYASNNGKRYLMQHKWPLDNNGEIDNSKPYIVKEFGLLGGLPTKENYESGRILLAGMPSTYTLYRVFPSASTTNFSHRAGYMMYQNSYSYSILNDQSNYGCNAYAVSNSFALGVTCAAVVKNSEITKVFYDGSFDQFETKYLNYNDYYLSTSTEKSYVYPSGITGKIYEKTEYNKCQQTNDWGEKKVSNISRSLDGINYTNLEKYSYNAACKVEEKSEKGFASEQYLYDSKGDLSKIKYAPFDSDSRFVNFSDYFLGKPRLINTKKSDSSSSLISYGIIYDNFGNITSVKYPDGITRYNSYDSIGRITSSWSSDLNFNSISFKYHEDESNGRYEEFSIGDYKQITYKDYSGNDAITKVYSKNDLNLKPIYRKNIYYNDSRAKLSTNPSFSLEDKSGELTIYDELGRVVSIENSNGEKSTFKYLPENSIEITDGEGNKKTIYYMSYGQQSYDKPLDIVESSVKSTKLAYDIFGNVTSIKQGGETELRIYDEFGRICLVVRNDIGSTSINYGLDGLVSSFVDGISPASNNCISNESYPDKIIRYSYDNHRNTKNIDFPGTDSDIQSSYDESGRVKNTSNNVSNVSYTYDSEGNVLSKNTKIDGIDLNASYKYDKYGFLSSLTYPSGLIVSYGNDVLGRVNKITTNIDGRPIELANITSHHANGIEKSFLMGNGIDYSSELDSASRPISRKYSLNSKQLINKLYSYTSNGSTKSITDLINNYASIDYGFDNGERLVKEYSQLHGNVYYSYDGVDNILAYVDSNGSKKYTYNLGVLNNFNGNIVKHDSRGNLTNVGAKTFSYDLSNRLKNANGVSILYNPLGQRIKKVSNGLNSYTIFDDNGRLLFRGDLHTKNINTVHMNGKVIAEIDKVIESPTINITMELNKVFRVDSDSNCPKGMVCDGVSYFYRLKYGWSTTDATTCHVKWSESENGVVKSFSIQTNIYQPLSYRDLSPGNILYSIEATCNGSKGIISSKKSVAGVGYSTPEEM